MQLHSLRPKTRMRREKRIGRGGKRGTTAGRGTKGQKARAGHKIRPQLRDLIKRFPKLRGSKFRSFQSKPYPVPLRLLEKHFSAGDSVTLEKLAAKGIISRRAGGIPKVKILGGAVSKKLSIIGIPISKGAKAAIEKAGGSFRLS